MTDSAVLIGAFARHGLTLAVAESLTGGLLTAQLTSVPGASAVVRGAMVVYATDTKAGVLGVDGDLLSENGPVSEPVARQMAAAVRQRFGADVGVSTTGVAGPDTQDGHPIGEVYVGTAWPQTRVERLQLSGSRSAIREQTVAAALAALSAGLREQQS